MTCYFRHLKPVFENIGLMIIKQNRYDIDRAIHCIVEVEYKNCSTTWKEVKKRMGQKMMETF